MEFLGAKDPSRSGKGGGSTSPTGRLGPLMLEAGLGGVMFAIFFGFVPHVAAAQGPSSASPATYTSPHTEAGGNFAEYVAEAGDVDGDGATDLLVGASGETVEGRERAGRAYLLSGASGEVLRELRAPTSRAERYFGYSVGGVGDTNGDGVPDLLVGAAGDSTLTGRAYLIDGATGTVRHHLVSPNAEPRGLFGRFPVGTDDVNGDGSRDVLIGAIGEDRAYLFGGADGDLIRVIESPSPAHDHFGYPAPIGDVDGDGVADIAIGAPTDSLSGKSRAGRVFIVGGDDGRGLQRLESPNAVSEGSFGHSVATIDNHGGAGPSTRLLVGASGEGKAYLLDVADGDVVREFASGDPSGTDDRFGQAVADVGDVDGDGASDLLVGAPTRNVDGADDAGKVYMFSGATGEILLTRTSPNSSREGYFGYSLAVVRDTENGSPEALCAGAFAETVGRASRAGRLYCFSL